MPEAGAIHLISGGLQDRPLAKKSRSTTNCPIFECSFSISASFPFPGSDPRRVNAVAMWSIAARFHVLIWFGCTPFAGSFGPMAFTGSLLRQLRQRHLFSDRLKRHLRLERRRMHFSLRHFGSSLPSGDPP
jgi:hypothetical protein